MRRRRRRTATTCSRTSNHFLLEEPNPSPNPSILTAAASSGAMTKSANLLGKEGGGKTG